MDISAAKEKAELRKQIRRLQSCLSPEGIAASNRDIIGRVLGLAEYRQAAAVFCFVGTAAEIDTMPLLRDALANRKRLAVPRCAGPGIMHAHVITGLEDLVQGAYGIMEPRSTCPPLPPEEIEFGVIPCVSCDRQGNRLGHGGGFYDRYLAGTAFPTAALCRETLLCERVPAGNLDVAVDIVVTDVNIYRISGRGMCL